MNTRYKLIEKLIFYLTFVTFFVVGIKSFQDYGISLDEKWHRETGILFYKYIKGLFFEINSQQNVEATTIKEIILNVDK